MFRTVRNLAHRVLRRPRPPRPERNDTAYLLSSERNAERLRAAIRELDEGRGTAVDLDALGAQLRGPQAG